MNARRFFLIVATLYALAFGVLSTRAATTNDYTYTGPGLTGLSELWPLPTEWMSDSGAQAIRQIKAALLNFATNSATGQHYLDGSHKTGFVTSAMIPTGAITRAHFGSNVTAQLLSSNGYSQLAMSDVFVQWAWSSNSYNTSSIFSISWPIPFTNDCWFADAGILLTNSAYNSGTNGFTTNEWSVARVLSKSVTNVWISLSISGTWTTQYQHRVSVLGVGR